MSTRLSFAQVCARATGTEIVQVDGLYMTKTLARAVRMNKDNYAVIRQQLKATQDFLATKSGGPVSKQFELMSLPYDVRHLILEYLVAPQNIRVFLRGGDIPIKLPTAACAGDSQLRRECLLVTLKTSTIEIHSGPGNAAFQKWLSNIDFTGVESFCETGFDAVTSLTFPYFSRFPYRNPEITKNNDVGLAIACRNLRLLILDFHVEELDEILFRHRNAEADHVSESALDLIQSYQLDGLLGATKLEELYFRACKADPYLALMTAMVTWFEQSFLERGLKVLVEVVTSMYLWQIQDEAS